VDSETVTPPTRFQQRDEAIASAAFDLFTSAYRALHATTSTNRLVQVALRRAAFDELAAWMGEDR
jgi:hypothetical protein